MTGLLITAKSNTWLKKSTGMALFIGKNEKHYVEKGETYEISDIIQTNNKHTEYELRWGLGRWWVYDNHWKIGVEPRNVESIYRQAMQFMLQWEGGYVNHPNDKGGATNKGVTQGTYNAYRRDKGLGYKSVRRITNNEVKDIYRNRYWLPSKANIIAECSADLAITHFDWAVNAGVSRAITTLQECVNTTPDGVWGANTQSAWLSSEPSNVIQCYLERREQLYRYWGKGSQSVFLTGWLNRLNSLRKELNQ
jgi:hypothetical protein